MQQVPCDKGLSMDVQMDMAVFDRNNRELGTVDKVIFEPHRTEMLAIVVSSGVLGRSRRVLAIDHVLPNERRRGLKTDLSDVQFSQLTAFDERKFRRPSRGWMATNGWSSNRVRWLAGDDSYLVADPPGMPPKDVETGTRRLTDTPHHAGHLDTCGCHLLEEQRDETRPHRFEVNPYDVLDGPVVACCRTPYEWGDASMINPLHDPAAGELGDQTNDLAVAAGAPFESSPTIDASKRTDSTIGETQ